MSKNSNNTKQNEESKISSACVLFYKNKISLKEASSMAEIPIEEFLQKLTKQKNPLYETDQKLFIKSLKVIQKVF